MSASEKLKALDVAATPVGWFDDMHFPEGVYNGCPTSHWDYYLDQVDIDLIVAVRNALPQIVAVVDCGPRVLSLLQRCSLHADSEGFQTTASDLREAHDELAAALAALEEKLEDPT
jgi:hypothetical protein